MSAADGGPAFPVDHSTAHSIANAEARGNEAAYLQALAQAAKGLSKRDYFAAKALQGFCANPAVFAENGRTGWGLVNTTPAQLLEYCIHLGDEALKARQS